MRKKLQLRDAYRFPGFRPSAAVHGVFGDQKARVITLTRRGKKRSAATAARFITSGMTAKPSAHAICPAATREYTLKQKYGEYSAGSAAK